MVNYITVTILINIDHNKIILNESEAKEVINSSSYSAEVKKDIEEASQIGVTGVPFFVFNRKYAVSGAQPSAAFVNVLEKSFSEWDKK